MIEVASVFHITCDQCKKAETTFAIETSAIQTSPEDNLTHLVALVCQELEDKGWESDLEAETCPECLRIDQNETIEENALKR